jgi:hypothetical protein
MIVRSPMPYLASVVSQAPRQLSLRVQPANRITANVTTKAVRMTCDFYKRGASGSTSDITCLRGSCWLLRATIAD